MHDEKIFPAWSLETDETLRILETSRHGLPDADVRLRQKHFGPNTLVEEQKLTWVRLLVRQFLSPLVFMLFVAAGIAALLHEWIDFSVIFLAIVVNAGLGFYQEFRAENALNQLTTYVRDRARVIRLGRDKKPVEQEIDSTLLVPGDIIKISYGARVPADARLIEVHNLSVDEAILSGESLPVVKQTAPLSEGTVASDRTNMVHAGTLILEGTATAVVTAIDSFTELGRIASLVSKTHDSKTPLQRALARMAWYLFVIVIVFVFGIFFLGISRGIPFFDMLLMASAIAVGAVPESLPIALTVILAVGLERLARRGGVMRNLAAAETLGSANYILTDKTGTLTEAHLKLVGVYTLTNVLEHSAASPLESMALIRAALASVDVTIENPAEPKSSWRFIGRPFETAIARAAIEHSIDVRKEIQNRPEQHLVFNSTNKFAIVESNGVLFAIGAPDILLARSKLTKNEFLRAEAAIQTISAEGKRLLGIARLSEVPRTRVATVSDAVDLDFLGVLVFKDPLRADVHAAVQTIERLGVNVVMVTGDLKGTALAIAHELGWKLTPGQILTGPEMAQLSDDELAANLSHLKIFARVTPEQKLRIARLYQRHGAVVGMTGDGVNDAPSLKAVDIGIALGSGSDVAKATADLVLLDDNFKTITAAIEEGRRILDNIRKVFVYLVSTCLNEVFLIGGALIFGLPLPLSALQIIWVNFFADSLPALSFAFDAHHSEHVREKRGVGGIFTSEVKVLTFGIGAVTSILLFVLYWYLLHRGVDVEHARSTVFLCFSLYVLVVALSLRHFRAPFYFKNFFANRMLTMSILFGAALTFATVTIPWLQRIFGVVLPPLNLMGVVAGWILFTLIMVECMKWLAIKLR